MSNVEPRRRQEVDIKDLGEEHFGGWAARNPEQVPLAFDECVSNTVPLFAGGADSWDNLAKQDLQVVWGTHSQLLARMR
ncbi:hypothetical protein ABT324_27475 [Saccharopolyspora sp. NPDC000359]|uniref:hypothetical protein n=1 Tax=Saccharopolyspora sp. NPDC000359 TaxID=3154251 RepID=UPI00332722E6